jgi:soluble lytic murein transglycosylase-like protein
MALFPKFAMLIVGILWFGAAVAEISLADALASSKEKVDPKVLTSLALQYEHAEGVPLDYAKAIALYCAAARADYAQAQYALGWMYAHGRGVTRDDAIAAQFFAMAAKQGHEQAREMLRYVSLANAASAVPSCLTPSAGDTTEAGAETVYPPGPIFNLVHKLAPRYAIDPNLALAVILVESGFNVQAVSPKNAQGLMQLTGETAQRFRVKNTFNAEDNIKGGLAYLQWLMALFRGNVSLVAAAYNAGERAVESHRGVPPYPETRNYVKKINALYKKALHPFQSDLVQASPIVMNQITNKN